VITKLELSYIAGFIDADGCIALYKNKDAYRPSLEIAQVGKPILEWIQSKIGCGKIYKIKRGVNNRQAHSLSVFPTELKEFLPAIIPYLKIKGRQAKLIMEYFDVIDSHTHRDKAKRPKLKKIKAEFNKLNKRGLNV